MNKRHKSELKAGLFINLGLVLLAVAVFFLGSQIPGFRKSDPYHFVLSDAQGLITGTKVYVAGIDAGRVAHLSLNRQTNQVRVDIEISRDYRGAIHQDGGVDLGSQGVLGDRAIYVTPGTPSKAEIGPGGELPIKQTLEFKDIVERGGQLMSDLDALTLNIDHFISRVNRRVRLDKANDAIGELDDLLEKIDSGQGTVGALVNDPSLYDDAKALVGEANSNRILRNIVRKSVEKGEKPG